MPYVSVLIFSAILVVTALVFPSFSLSQSTLTQYSDHYALGEPSPNPPQNLTEGNGSHAFIQGQESHQVGHAAPPAWPWQIYKSAPFNPPELEITTNGQPLAPGLIFISPSDASSRNSSKENAVLILTDTGQLVWNGPTVTADNFRVASYEGRDILTYWTGGSTSATNIGHGYGNVTFLDSSYNEILVVCPQLGLMTTDNSKPQCEGDLHESFVTERDTILVTAYNVTKADLSTIGGPVNAWVFDCLFFELNPKDGRILFSWSALEHIPVSDTKRPLAGTGRNQSVPFDWFHINSVVNIGDSYLMNSRHLWTTYLITSKGEVAWTLQGENGGDFGPLPDNGHFSWQHFARPHNITNSSISISWFNNFNSEVDNGTHPSNLLELKLPLPPNKYTPPIALQYQSYAKDPIYADSQGSNSILANGNAFGGYGQIPVIREFGPNDPSGGDLRWSGRFGPDNLVQSYRAYKQEWHATPRTIPSLVVDFEGEGGTGYVSWNGATDVSAWVLSEGPTEHELEEMGRFDYKGFETKFPVSHSYVQVAALVNGKLTRSNIVGPKA